MQINTFNKEPKCQPEKEDRNNETPGIPLESGEAFPGLVRSSQGWEIVPAVTALASTKP